MITPDYLLHEYEYMFKCESNGRSWWAFGHTIEQFNEGLKMLNALDQYYNYNEKLSVCDNGQVRFDI